MTKENKLKTYRLFISWDGRGFVHIKAKSEKDAKDKFYSGEWEVNDLEDESEGYTIEEIEKVGYSVA